MPPKVSHVVLRPGQDLLRGLDRCLVRGWRGLAGAAVGLLAGWWIYVPIHELLHAAACWAAGGSVSRLEIDRAYGGGLLARMFPFVTPGSAYAGRLAGFDTGGSDLVYLATDLGPFLLTLWPGVWALRAAAAARRPVAFGAALPFALAPFLSLTGDAYEIGSIVTTRIPPWTASALRTLLRGDDLLRIAPGLAGAGPTAWMGFTVAALLGLLWAFATYAAGGAVAQALGRGPVQAESFSQSASGAS
jgi:hypothetical protein